MLTAGGRDDAERRRIGHAHAGALRAHHRDLFRLARIGERVLEQEAVELRLGQRISALLLDRILGRDHHEALAERMGLAVQRDMALLHRLQQRGLRLGRGAVDLVRQQQLAEDRPAADHEAGRLEIELVGADNVARQEIGRELDAPELQPQARREALRQQRLGCAGWTFEQHMPPENSATSIRSTVSVWPTTALATCARMASARLFSSAMSMQYPSSPFVELGGDAQQRARVAHG